MTPTSTLEMRNGSTPRSISRPTALAASPVWMVVSSLSAMCEARLASRLPMGGSVPTEHPTDVNAGGAAESNQTLK